MTAIDVRCVPLATGWRCVVTVDDGQGTSHHDVTLATEQATDLAAATDGHDVERLVYETFAFLLEREPKESILRSFDLTVVSRYFPEFEAEIRSRLAP
jgi:hypothetical protein